MSKTYRVNPETFEEAIERNYLKRKKKEDQQRRSEFYNNAYEMIPDDCQTNDNERND